MAKRETNAQRGDREFRYKNFTVMVPRSVLKAWDTQHDKQLGMTDALRHAATQSAWGQQQLELRFPLGTAGNRLQDAV